MEQTSWFHLIVMVACSLIGCKYVSGILDMRLELLEQLPVEYPSLAELGDLKNPIDDVITSNMLLHNFGFVLYFSDYDDDYSLCAKKGKDEVLAVVKVAVVAYIEDCLLPPYRQELLWHDEYESFVDNLDTYDLEENILDFVKRAMTAFADTSNKVTLFDTLKKRNYTDSFVAKLDVLQKEFDNLLEIKKVKEECVLKLVTELTETSKDFHYRFLDCAGIPRPDVSELEEKEMKFATREEL